MTGVAAGGDDELIERSSLGTTAARRLRERVGRSEGSFMTRLAGSFAGQSWEFKLGIGQARPGMPDRELAGPTGDSSLGYAEYPQAAPAGEVAGVPETHGNSDRLHLPRISADENSSRASFWDSLNADQKRAFRAKAHERVFASGARLMQEGELGDHVAVILSGLTQIRVREGDTERIVAVRGRGQLIGERAALEMNPRSATVVAMQRVMALVVHTEDFVAFISTYPAVLKIVEDQIFTRLREGRTDQELADGQPALAPAGIRQVGQGPPQLTGQNCTVIRSDVVAFGAAERDAEAHKIIKRALPAMTELALGPAWATCRQEDRGDGLLIIVPPDIPTAQVIERLVTVLPSSLKQHNRIYEAPARIQLRVAVDVGPVEEDVAGIFGQSVIRVSRLLDAPAFKHAVTGQRALLGLIVSPFIYANCVRNSGGRPDPTSYTQIPVRVKETRTSGWMHMVRPGEQLMPICGNSSDTMP